MHTESRPPARIAVVIGQLGQGGSERQLYSFLKHCDRDRWMPVVFVSGGPLGYWNDRILDLGIEVVSLSGSRLARMMQFRRHCSARNVSQFFSWASHTNAYAVALFGLGVPGIGSFRNFYGHDLPDRFRWFRAWLNTVAISTAVCNSRETALDVQHRAGKHLRVVYVPNCVEPTGDINHFRRLWRQRLGIMDNDILVLGVGRLSEQKNFGRFIEAVAIARQNAGIKAVVAGRDDGCLESLEQQAVKLGLDEDVLRFIGLVPDAREVMCAADIFLLSSDYEGMPNVILEAMAARVACVSTRVNGVGDLIESGVSGFVTDHRSEDLADKIQLLALDENLRRQMGEEAAKRVAHSFEPEYIAGQLWQLCE